MPDAERPPQNGAGAVTGAGGNGDGEPAVSTDAGLSARQDPGAEPDPEVVATLAPSTAAVGRTRRYRDDDVSDDDGDLGWGDRPGGLERGDGWYLRERPPHHG